MSAAHIRFGRSIVRPYRSGAALRSGWSWALGPAREPYEPHQPLHPPAATRTPSGSSAVIRRERRTGSPDTGRRATASAPALRDPVPPAGDRPRSAPSRAAHIGGAATDRYGRDRSSPNARARSSPGLRGVDLVRMKLVFRRQLG